MLCYIRIYLSKDKARYKGLDTSVKGNHSRHNNSTRVSVSIAISGTQYCGNCRLQQVKYKVTDSLEVMAASHLSPAISLLCLEHEAFLQTVSYQRSTDPILGLDIVGTSIIFQSCYSDVLFLFNGFPFNKD